MDIVNAMKLNHFPLPSLKPDVSISSKVVVFYCDHCFRYRMYKNNEKKSYREMLFNERFRLQRGSGNELRQTRGTYQKIAGPT